MHRYFSRTDCHSMSVTTHDGWAAAGRSVTQSRIAPAGADALTVYLDLDTVLLAMHRGRRGIELGVQGNLREGVERLLQIADHIVVLAYPPTEATRRVSQGDRLGMLRSALDGQSDDLLIAQCRHASDGCDCAKPGSGLIRQAIRLNGLPVQGGWFIGADQEGVVSGRGAGLHTIRIGPEGHDHLSVVHRPDYEARDLLDAANHIMLEALA